MKTLPLVAALAATLPTIGVAQDIAVFVSDRDGNREIYSIDGSGTVANLSNHPGRDQAPSVSSTGRIAWMSDRSGRLGVWTMNADGSDQRLLRDLPEADFGVSWSPDAKSLAITLQTDDGPHDVAILDVGTGSIQRLTNTPNEEEITPSWSPSGNALYYVVGNGPTTRLVRHDPDSGNTETVAFDLPSAGFPDVSPDGTTAVLRSRTDQFDVLLVELQTGAVHNLTNHPANDWGAVWSTDGMSVLFASDRDGDMELYSLGIGTGELVQLTHNEHRDWMPSVGGVF